MPLSVELAAVKGHDVRPISECFLQRISRLKEYIFKADLTLYCALIECCCGAQLQALCVVNICFESQLCECTVESAVEIPVLCAVVRR